MIYELLPNDGSWKHVESDVPPEGCLVLVFREKNRKYVVARATAIKDHKEAEDQNHTHDWITQQNLCYRIRQNDLWMPFPYVQIKTSYF